jgi:hypothetical protein
MASKLPITQKHESRLLQALFPSGLASITVHSLIIAIVFVTTRGCEQGMPANAGNDKFRTVEITEIASTTTGQISQDTPSPEGETPPHKVDVEPIPAVEPTSPVGSTARTQAMEPLNDTGHDVPLPEFAQPPLMILPGGSNTVEGSQNPDSTEPALANNIESGTRFVFLIDTSDSMRNSNRWYLAQIQLMSNLRMLKPHQEFQIIFYSAHPATMQLLVGKRTVYQANARNLANAEKVLEAVSLGGRANHLLALREGLKLKPDGI